ncbi:hypothetical protein MXL82_11635 [Staphylococcus gallinarum]|uniref:hypothetical protein n=1 Tax=Staphylococcus gallinarum TaxID=1293 RepID=UPI002DB6187C|nr:hypothetical protein [Staphylococcus gallinarum]MEB6243735.1 hypothetical protein [Staphylococcus gallinarum]MEB6296881.1 hypothetical protein [Staphylococcus gallinarum]
MEKNLETMTSVIILVVIILVAIWSIYVGSYKNLLILLILAVVNLYYLYKAKRDNDNN